MRWLLPSMKENLDTYSQLDIAEKQTKGHTDWAPCRILQRLQAQDQFTKNRTRNSKQTQKTEPQVRNSKPGIQETKCYRNQANEEFLGKNNQLPFIIRHLNQVRISQDQLYSSVLAGEIQTETETSSILSPPYWRIPEENIKR
jgi:hypothetical protein